MRSRYLMEGLNEGARLAIKDRAAKTYEQLLITGITDYMSPAARIVDAGAGVGVVGEQIAEIAINASRTPEILLLDASEDRLNIAKERLSKYDLKKSFLTCDLERIPLPDKSVDYLFCRFVFEYLKSPKKVFSEFIRVMKPGGKLVVGDLDNNSLSHFPLPDKLQSQLDMIVSELENIYHFDFHAGRKIYSYFFDYNCKDIKVNLYAHHLLYGDIDNQDEFNWSTKLDRLISLQKEGEIILDFSVQEFSREFLEFLKSPGSFSYTPLILVEGVVDNG